MNTPERLRAESAKSTNGHGATNPVIGEFGCYLAGTWKKTGKIVEVRSPYDGSLVALIHRAQAEDVSAAIDSAVSAFKVTRKLPGWKRAEILEQISAAISGRKEELARTIALEAGKPISTARAEVGRAVFTFKVAAEESKRIYGEIVPLDWIPGNEGREAQVRRVPLGPVVGISPFNYPLNLVAHKVAPALAAGDPIILRPASQTPVSALQLAEIICESGWPADGFSVLPCSTDAAKQLVEDERIRLLTFTGSPAVGWGLKSRAGRKRVTLELGGNAGVIIHKDADLEYAAERVAWGGFSYSGQSCVSVQRVYLHDDIYEAFVSSFIPRVVNLKVGDPLLDDTDIGPVIDPQAAERIEEWVDEAERGGAEILTGGRREGNLWPPTVLAGLKPTMKVCCQEVFAPIVGLYRYHDIKEAVDAVDDSEFGLQAGLFTNDLRIIRTAFDAIEVGGLMVNDVSTFRVDHMPYGGVKQSGAGREGLRYAIEEMSEMKLLTLNTR
ncbi:MAG TPA: aldehyde dehydrogenase family protein [Spirochaetia bacterium]|nr:aldehyde dehydrogenase family protein [Spirochaetia bacterium]